MALGTSAAPSIQGKKGFVFQAAKECSQDASTHPPQVHTAWHCHSLLVVHGQPASHVLLMCVALQVREPDKKRLKIDQGPALEDSVFRILH